MPPEVCQGTSAATGVSRLSVAGAAHLRICRRKVRGQGARQVGGVRWWLVKSRDGSEPAKLAPTDGLPTYEWCTAGPSFSLHGAFENIPKLSRKQASLLLAIPLVRPGLDPATKSAGRCCWPVSGSLGPPTSASRPSCPRQPASLAAAKTSATAKLLDRRRASLPRARGLPRGRPARPSSKPRRAVTPPLRRMAGFDAEPTAAAASRNTVMVKPPEKIATEGGRRGQRTREALRRGG